MCKELYDEITVGEQMTGLLVGGNKPNYTLMVPLQCGIYGEECFISSLQSFASANMIYYARFNFQFKAV